MYLIKIREMNTQDPNINGPSPVPSNLRALPLQLLVALCLAFAAYSNTFDVPFHFDDFPNIVESPLVRDLSYYTSPSKGMEHDHQGFFARRFMGYLSFALNYKLGGLQVQGYHAVNLLVHLTNVTLVYFLVLMLFRTPRVSLSAMGHDAQGVAFVAALLFALHPLQTQAVTYIVQRFTSMVAMFYLGSLVLYARARMTQGLAPRLALAIGAAICAALAMKTKENAFTLPIAVLLMEAMFFTGSIKRRLGYLAPILLTLLIIPFTIIGLEFDAERLSEATRLQTTLSRDAYFITQLAVAMTYLRLMAYPAGLNVDHDHPVYDSLFAPAPLLGAVVLASLLALAVMLVRRSRHEGKGHLLVPAFGIAFFFIAMAVESSIFPIADVIFEHRTYLPLAGVALAIASAVSFATNRASNIKFAKMAAAVVLTLGICALGTLTYERNKVWQSRISLWEDVAQKSPAKARPHYNLGLYYFNRGEHGHAREHLDKSILIEPDNVDTYYNLGLVYYELGQMDKAIGHLESAVEQAPMVAHWHKSLALAYKMANRSMDALGSYRMAAKLNPFDHDIHMIMGIICMENGLYAEARKHFGAMLKHDPGSARATRYLGYLHYLDPA